MGRSPWILPTPKHTKNPTYEVKISIFKHFFYGCFISYVHMYINNTTKSPGEEFLNIQEFGKNLKTLQSTLCNVWFWFLGLLWMSPEREIPLIHTATLPKKPMFSCRDPLQNWAFISEHLAAFLYAVWILNSKKNAKVRNASKILFISPISAKQLLKNKFYMV